jgi:hypothetical protein
MSTSRRNIAAGLVDLFKSRKFNRGATWGLIILTALLAFEIFNFSTTQFALTDILGGELKFAGLRWATILAIAFCGIDFAGIARIFTPEQGRDEPAEVYYLFGAWLLAAAFNASLTWWGVSVAIVNHTSLGAGAVISNAAMTKAVPVFVAVMVWLIRVLIIGTFSLAGDRLFTTANQPRYSYTREAAHGQTLAVNQPALRSASSLNRTATINSLRTTPAPKPLPVQQSAFTPPEPVYHPASYGARPADKDDRRYDA